MTWQHGAAREGLFRAFTSFVDETVRVFNVAPLLAELQEYAEKTFQTPSKEIRIGILK
jgi:hypothetical protein